MTNYSRGRSFEWRVQAHFEADGYGTMRAAQSRGAADILAGKNGVWFAIQCQVYKNFDSAKIENLLEFCRITGARPVLAWRLSAKDKWALQFKYLDAELLNRDKT